MTGGMGSTVRLEKKKSFLNIITFAIIKHWRLPSVPLNHY